MPTFPVRRLGSSGIVADTQPADIEDPAIFTAGVNVRFKNGRVSRGPVARTIIETPHEPGHVLTIPPGAAGFDEVVSIAQDFSTLYRLNGTVWENLTPAGHIGSAGSQAITSSFLGGLSYVNRESHAPLYKGPSDGTYLNLPNWVAGDRCKVLRSYKDQLVALGVTKAGVFYPTLVKVSDLTGFGTYPASWDPTITTNSAVENIVNDMTHPIVDGLTLRDSFILYCTSSVWSMDYVGGDFLFAFRKLLDESGVLGVNCVVQVGGLHYVFGRTDIFVHDGVSPKSIADEKVKEFVFKALDFSRSHLCFTTHDARLGEVRFTYPSSDRLVGFHNPTTGCNRQAVFNYTNGTWTFYDVPNITSATKAALVRVPTFNTDMDITFDEVGGLFSSTDGDEDRHVMYVGRPDAGQGLSAPRLYGIDLLTGGRLALPAEPEALKTAFVERIGLDLDVLGKNLTQHVNLQAFWPQMVSDNPGDCYWQFGGSDNVNVEPAWSPEMTFDPTTETKIDINETGKYLAYRFGCRGLGDFALSAFDIQLIIRGRR